MKKIAAIVMATLLVMSVTVALAGGVATTKEDQPEKVDRQIFENKEINVPSEEDFVADEIIVKFKAGTSDETISLINSKNTVVSAEKIVKKNPKAVENEKTKILKKHGLDRIYLLKSPKNTDVNEMVSNYNENPDVEYAEPNYKVYVDATATIPNDYYFYLLWGMHNTGQSGGTEDADIDAPEAWAITTGSSDIVVAVIDTGVDYNHPDLNDNMWTNPNEIAGDGIDNDGNNYIDDIRGWDFYNNDNNPFDDNGHGTHCSGTIAAEGNNGIGVVGVSWNAKIMPLKFLNRRGSGDTSDAIAAINYATLMGADIMSNSWGGGGYSEALEDAISAADEAGILFVAAAGNTGTDNDVTAHYPSSYEVPNVISVAATDRYDNLASFSCYGLESVDLGAPGVTIASTYPGNRYVYMDGTSMAAPHVSGAAALIKAYYPDITVADLKARILDSVDPINALTGKTVTGGRLNVANCLDTTPDTTAPLITGVSSSVTSTTATITWTTNEPADSTVNYGTTTALNKAESDENMTTSHAITLTGLSSGTTYYYEVKSTDASGNTATNNNSGGYYTFATTEQSAYSMHVSDIEMSLSTRSAGRNIFYHATATVTIVDADEKPVAGATVSGFWSGATGDIDLGVTDSNGQVSLSSDSVKNPPSGTAFTFTVDGVTHADLTWDGAVESGSITV